MSKYQVIRPDKKNSTEFATEEEAIAYAQREWHGEATQILHGTSIVAIVFMRRVYRPE